MTSFFLMFYQRMSRAKNPTRHHLLSCVPLWGLMALLLLWGGSAAQAQVAPVMLYEPWSYSPGSPVYLYWSDSADENFESYKIYRGTTPGVTAQNGTLIATLTDSYENYYEDYTATSTPAPGTTYYYMVVVTNTAAQSAESNEESILLINDPPEELTLHTLNPGSGQNGVWVYWEGGGDSDLNAYKIYRGTTPGFVKDATTLIGTNPKNNLSTAFNDTTAMSSVSPGTTYYYAIRAIDDAGQITTSNEMSVTLINPVPNSVDLYALNPGSGQNGVWVYWNGGGDTDLNAYKIYRGTTPNFVKDETTLIGTNPKTNLSTSFNDTTAMSSVSPGTTYYYVIHAVDDAGQITASNERSVTLTNPLPNAVDLYALNPGSGQNGVWVYWSGGGDTDLNSYKIYRGTTPGFTPDASTLIGTNPKNNLSTSFNDTTAMSSVAPGTTYYYVIHAVDEAGQITASNEKSVTLTNPVPNSVDLYALNPGSGQNGVWVYWNGGGDTDLNAYKIYRGTTPNFVKDETTLIGTNPKNNLSTSFNDTTAMSSVSPGTTYYYVIHAVDDAGQITASNEKSVTLINPLPNTVDLYALNPGSGQNGVWVYWSGGGDTDLNAYKIYRGTTPGFVKDETTLIGTNPKNNLSTSFNDTTAMSSVSPGTTYYYVIHAVDDAGQITASNERSVTLINPLPNSVDLYALNPGSGQNGVWVYWNGGGDTDLNAYKIYRGTTPNFVKDETTLIGTNPKSNLSTSFNDTTAVSGVAPGNTYYYVIHAVDDAGQITASNERSITLLNAAPSAFTLNDLQVEEYERTAVSLYWSNSNDTDLASYKIYRGTTPGVTPQTGQLLATYTRDEGLYTWFLDENVSKTAPPGNTYYYVIYATDDAEQVTKSNEKSITLVNQPPSALTLAEPEINAAPGGANAHLSWTGGEDDDLVSYKIYRSTVANFTPDASTLVGTRDNNTGLSQEYTDGPLIYGEPPGTTFYFVVVATDSLGQSVTSNQVSVTLAHTPPTAVTLNPLTESSSSGNTKGVHLNWTRSADPEFSSYKIYRSTSPSVSTSSTLVTTITNQNTVDYYDTVNGTSDPGITYYYRVFVFNGAGQSAGSNEQSFVAITVPNLKTSYQFNGKGNWSIDGVGRDGDPVGTLEALVPPGSKIEKAFLYSTMFEGYAPPTVDFDGSTYSDSQWTALGVNNANDLWLQAYRVDVTTQVKQKVGNGSLARFTFGVGSESPGYNVDGEVLAIVYSNSGEEERTIAFLDGFSNSSGDSTRINLAEPLPDPQTPGFQALMSLGIGFSYRPSGQFSQIEINGRRLTTDAGGADDGIDEDGTPNNSALITVGGLDDSSENPADPFYSATGYSRYDDELYDLARGNNANPNPFLQQGISKIDVDTLNPSSDDNIFFLGINITARAGVNQLPPEPGTR